MNKLILSFFIIFFATAPSLAKDAFLQKATLNIDMDFVQDVLKNQNRCILKSYIKIGSIKNGWSAYYLDIPTEDLECNSETDKTCIQKADTTSMMPRKRYDLNRFIEVYRDHISRGSFLTLQPTASLKDIHISLTLKDRYGFMSQFPVNVNGIIIDCDNLEKPLFINSPSKDYLGEMNYSDQEILKNLFKVNNFKKINPNDSCFGSSYISRFDQCQFEKQRD